MAEGSGRLRTGRGEETSCFFRSGMKLNFLRFHVRRYIGLGILELGEKEGVGGLAKTGRDLNNSVAGLLGLEQLSPTP